MRTLFLSFLVLIVITGFGLYVTFKKQPSIAGISTTQVPVSGAVLADTITLPTQDSNVTFNIPAIFNDSVSFKNGLVVEGVGDIIFKNNISSIGNNLNLGSGLITAGNILYSLTSGSGIEIGTGQTPTITNTGVTSLSGETGELDLEAGDGISIDGLEITNDDAGSAQNIFKNLSFGDTTFSAGSNDDSFSFLAGTGISFQTDTENNSVTINSAAEIPDTGWLIDGQGNINATPSGIVDISGTLNVAGSTTVSASIADTTALTIKGSSSTQGVSTNILDVQSSSGQSYFSIDNLGSLTVGGSRLTNTGSLESLGAIRLLDLDNTMISTAVEGGWTLNGNTYNYRRTVTVTNNSIITIPTNYEVSVSLYGVDSSQIYSNTQTTGLHNDFRTAFNSTPTEIARNIFAHTANEVTFTFQVQTAIPVLGSSTYYIYYDNPLIASIPSQYSSYVGSIQLDAMDAVASWTSSDPIQFPLSQELTTKQEGTGSIKSIATVDNIGFFSAVTQGQLPSARTNFGFATYSPSGTKYIYAVGGSSDGTASNAQATIFYSSINPATGNVGAFSTNANNLTAPLMDSSVTLATPPIDSGTGADGALDLASGAGIGGCTGNGLSWDAGSSTCTLVSDITLETGQLINNGAKVNLGSNSFTIPSGPEAGKQLIITGNLSKTVIYNPATDTFTDGPDLGGTAGRGSHAILLPAGYSDAGKVLTILGGGSAITKLYDPATNTFTAGPALGANISYGAHSFVIPAGNSESGKIMTLGFAANTTKILDFTTFTYGAGPNLTATLAQGGHSIVIPAGYTHVGKILTILGNGTITTNIYDPSTNTFAAGPDLTSASGGGGHSIVIPAGYTNSGKILTIVGGTTAITNIYDQSTDTFIAGPSLVGGSASYGAHSIVIPSGAQAGKVLTIGSVNSGATTILNTSTGNYDAGPDLGLIAANATSFIITSGIQQGKIITLAGNATSQTSLYEPSTNTFGPGPDAGTIISSGSHNILIPSGSEINNYLIIVGGKSPETKIFRTSTGTVVAGPNLGVRAAIGSHSFLIPSGTNSGKILTVLGNNTQTTKIFDPATNTYIAGPDLGANAEEGSHSFLIPSGTNAGKILTILGNGTGTTKIYDPITNTFGAGPALGFNASLGSHSFTIPSGTNAGKILTIVGNSSHSRIFDPESNSYGAGPESTGNYGSGAHSILISSGSQAGKILTFVSGGVTNIFDPSTNAYTLGPAIGVSASAGAHSSLIPAGFNAGKIYTVIGGATPYIRLYNPATNTFGLSTDLGSNVGDGSQSIVIPSGFQKGKMLLFMGGSSSITYINFGKLIYNFSSINIPVGTTLTSDGPKTISNFLNLKSTGNVNILGAIDMLGKGYAAATVERTNGLGPGYGSAGSVTKGGGGGSYGGAGGTGGNGDGGGVYTADDSGSSGGMGYNANTAYSKGGGGIKIVSSGTITVSGSINTNGSPGYGATNYGGGGGSGGRISLVSPSIVVSGTLSANGGAGGNGSSAGGGGGGGGRITLEYLNSLNTTGSTITASGGAKGTGGTSSVIGSAGVSNQVLSSSVMYVLGGKNSSGNATANIYQGVVSPVDGSIGVFTTSVTSLPQNIFGHSANTLTVNNTNYLYVIGGNNGTADQTTVYKGSFSGNDIASFTTTGQTQLPQGLSFHSSSTALIGGINYLYFIGGLSGGTPQTTIYKATINSTTGNIDTLTNVGQAVLPQGLFSSGSFVAAVGANNYLYIIGGHNGTSNQTTVYKASIDSSGNVTPGTISTLGQTQLSAGISAAGVTNYTDTSNNQYAYLIGGTTGTPQSSVGKTLYSPINQTAYSQTRSITPVDLTNKNEIQFKVNSSRTGAYAAFEIENGSGWQTCGNNADFTSGVYTINSANVWETKTCDISGITPRTAISQMRIRVTNSSSTPWTSYLDDIWSMTSTSVAGLNTTKGSAILGAADITINAQGEGAIKLNFGGNGVSAGTGGMKLYDGGTNVLFEVNSSGVATMSGIKVANLATASGLFVSGVSTLADTVITGGLGVGTNLVVLGSESGMSASLDNAFGTLKLQPSGAGIEFIGNKIEMDASGNLKIKNGYLFGNSDTRGVATIPAEAATVTISKTWTSTPSSIITTANFDSYTWVNNKTSTGFEIKVKTPPVTEGQVFWTATW